MPSPIKVLLLFGTRPEAIKMAPLVRALAAPPARFRVETVVTGQHREMLDQVLELFAIRPQEDLAVMRPGQDLAGLTARVVEGVDALLARRRPDLVLVQGDTTTTFAAALAAFYRRIPVGHVEAGLRTGDLAHPFPEEANRLMTTRLAALHFAPTEWARDNLLREGVDPDTVHVTGNTVVDALNAILERPHRLPEPLRAAFAGEGPRLLLTCHRRENHGAGVAAVCQAVETLLARHPRARVVAPVHLNPAVAEVIRERLGGHPRAHLVPPLDYLDFVHAMRASDLILSDSGGVQEEAPALGRPVLVLRETTERPEAVAAGTARLVGCDPERIVAEAHRLLTDPAAYQAMARAANPFGDGRAAVRIRTHIERFFA